MQRFTVHFRRTVEISKKKSVICGNFLNTCEYVTCYMLHANVALSDTIQYEVTRDVIKHDLNKTRRSLPWIKT